MPTTPGDIYELVHEITEGTNGTKIINVYHFKALNSTCTANTLIVDWRTAQESALRSTLANNATITRIQCFNLIPFQTDYAQLLPNTTGTSGGSSIAGLVATIVTWRTALPGRRYRGRTYLGPCVGVNCSGGVTATNLITGVYAVWANAVLNTFGATGTSTSARIGVWSRVLGNQKPPHNVAGFTQITSMNVQKNLGSMGTRRVGRGP